MSKKRVHPPAGHAVRTADGTARTAASGRAGASTAHPGRTPTHGVRATSRASGRSAPGRGSQQGRASQPTSARDLPPSGHARARLEDASRPLLLRLKALPGFLIPAVLAIALFLGLAIAQPWAGLLLVAISTFLSWLTALSWPAIGPGPRTLRVTVNLGVMVLGALKLLGII